MQDQEIVEGLIENSEPETNHADAKSDAAMLAEKVEAEKRERAEECLRRINEVCKDLNCTPEIVPVLLSTQWPAQVGANIVIRALDW